MMNAPSPPRPAIDRRTGRSAFGANADGYHQSRSGYPAALFEYLQQKLPSSPNILEIGAGTGLASMGLLACNPARLAIVEPDARLCSVLRTRLDDPRVDISNGSFPELDVDGPFDLIACAAAFHWMEPQAALARIKSLLAPDGLWAMWWNCYLGHGEDDPLADLAMTVIEDEGIALPPSFRPGGHYALDVDAQMTMLRDAGFDGIEHRLFRTVRELGPDQVRQLFESFSFIHILPPEDRGRILDRVSRIVSEDLGGCATSVVVTSLYTSTGGRG